MMFHQQQQQNEKLISNRELFASMTLEAYDEKEEAKKAQTKISNAQAKKEFEDQKRQDINTRHIIHCMKRALYRSLSLREMRETLRPLDPATDFSMVTRVNFDGVHTRHDAPVLGGALCCQTIITREDEQEDRRADMEGDGTILPKRTTTFILPASSSSIIHEGNSNNNNNNNGASSILPTNNNTNNNAVSKENSNERRRSASEGNNNNIENIINNNNNNGKNNNGIRKSHSLSKNNIQQPTTTTTTSSSKQSPTTISSILKRPNTATTTKMIPTAVEEDGTSSVSSSVSPARRNKKTTKSQNRHEPTVVSEDDDTSSSSDGGGGETKIINSNKNNNNTSLPPTVRSSAVSNQGKLLSAPAPPTALSSTSLNSTKLGVTLVDTYNASASSSTVSHGQADTEEDDDDLDDENGEYFDDYDEDEDDNNNNNEDDGGESTMYHDARGRKVDMHSHVDPTKNIQFTFTDFAPMCYRHIRHFFGIEPEKFLKVLVESNWHSIPTPGKSSAQLYFCGQNWVIKTMTAAESDFLSRILHRYYYHVRDNPHTLLPHFVGHHRIQFKDVDGSDMEFTFVIMQNVFATPLKIHTKFDLKGSTVGRLATAAEKKKTTCTQKDLDVNRPLRLGETRKNLLVEQIRRDCDFLRRSEIMDYSFLVGIHDMSKGYPIWHNVPVSSMMNQQQTTHVVTTQSQNSAPSFFQKSSSSALPSPQRFPHQQNAESSPDPMNRNYFSASSNQQQLHAEQQFFAASGSLQNPRSANDDDSFGDVSGGIPNNFLNTQQRQQRNMSEASIHSQRHQHSPPPLLSVTNASMTLTSTTSQKIDPISGHDPAAASQLTAASTNPSHGNIADANNNIVGSSQHEILDLMPSSASQGATFNSIQRRKRGQSGIHNHPHLQQAYHVDPFVEQNNNSNNPSFSNNNQANNSNFQRPAANSSNNVINFSGRSNNNAVAFAGFENQQLQPSSTFQPNPNTTSINFTNNNNNNNNTNAAAAATTTIDETCFTSDSGGMMSLRRDEIYYVGIIDVLQEYNWWKRAETVIMGIVHDREHISSVDPRSYATRFIEFMDSLML